MKKRLALGLGFLLCTTLVYPVVAEEEVSETIEVQEEAPEVRSGVDVTNDFTDPAFREFVVENYGTDGIVMDTDLALVDEIIAVNLGIQDLSGIEHFPSATAVDLAKNNLGDISLSTFPSAVRSLNLTEANVTSINTVGGENIETITITKNPISTLDLSNLTSLINFNSANMTSAFTSLDFSVAPWIKTVTVQRCYIKNLDLSMMTNLEAVYVSGSLVEELILPSYITTENFHTFMLDQSRLEFVNYTPATADVWRTSNLRPLKEIKVNAEGYPYIEMHRDSVVTNLDELNAEQEDFVYDADASTLTWVASQDAEEFFNLFNKKILFSNGAPATRAAAQPLTGYYQFYPLAVPEPPMVTAKHTVNFLDCDGKLVGQAWPEDGEDAVPPAGYSYEASLITNVTFSKDVSPLGCSAGFAIPNTGRK